MPDHINQPNTPMALGSNPSFSNSPLIFLTPSTKDKEGNDAPPHFRVARSTDGKIESTGETVTSVGGDLFRVEVKEREFNGEPSWEGILYLRDNDVNESYRVTIRFGVAGRSLFNRLSALTENKNFTGLLIDYYENKKGYDAFGLKQNEEKIEWKYSLDEQPKPEDIMHKGKLVKRDYTGINEFFKTELLAIAAALGTPAAGDKTTPPAKVPAASPGPVTTPAPKTAVVTKAKTTPKSATKTSSTLAPVTAPAANEVEGDGPPF